MWANECDVLVLNFVFDIGRMPKWMDFELLKDTTIMG
jgi:hypothetical protein